jgi:glutamine amidotransferase
MSYKVVIIDYQLGNLFSVKQACEYLGYDALISSKPEDLMKADYAILPGVGAFADAMKNLNEFGLSDAIKQYVQSGKSFMGVCLGQQLLLTGSQEFENTQGLGLIAGSVKKIPMQRIEDRLYKVPQIQWNTIVEPTENKWNNTPLLDCKNGDYVYFVHSFYTDIEDKKDVLAYTNYGSLKYCSSVLNSNIFTTQFHPEKSGLFGLNIYKNWFNLNK